MQATFERAFGPAFHPARSLLALVVWTLLTFAVAAVASLAAPGEWYAGLRKPVWNPPGWLFAPVWTALYAMMAFAAWLVWHRGGWAAQARPLGWFLLQLALNGLWSWVFFGWHRPGLAFAEILLLWAAILLTIRSFAPVSRPAAWLLIPYLAWVTFASVLNFSLWRLNA
jgi:tryptophan-rich sensory protein